jgi:hypothetical protein
VKNQELEHGLANRSAFEDGVAPLASAGGNDPIRIGSHRHVHPVRPLHRIDTLLLNH